MSTKPVDWTRTWSIDDVVGRRPCFTQDKDLARNLFSRTIVKRSVFTNFTILRILTCGQITWVFFQRLAWSGIHISWIFNGQKQRVKIQILFCLVIYFMFYFLISLSHYPYLFVLEMYFSDIRLINGLESIHSRACTTKLDTCFVIKQLMRKDVLS